MPKNLRVVAFRRVGHILREERKSQGLSLIDLGLKVGISQPKLSNVENGKAQLSESEFDLIAEILHLEDSKYALAKELRRLAAEPGTPVALIHLLGVQFEQRQVRELEASALKIRHFADVVVPGLLQIPEYSRKIFEQLGVPSGDVESAVRERAARSHNFLSRSGVYQAVISEAALYTSMGSPEVCARQLRFLSNLVLSPDMKIGIMPTVAGAVLSAPHGFTIYDERLVTAETMSERIEAADSSSVALYSQTYSELHRRAVFGGRARAVVSEAAAYFSRAAQ